MVAYGVQLTTEQENAIMAICLRPKFFTREAMQEALRVGIPAKGRGEHFNRSPAKQAVCLTIQKLKRAGKIRRLREGVWATAEAMAA